MLPRNVLVSIFALLTCSTVAFCQGAVDFNRDVRPILSDRCFVCHGPDEANREADLRLDQTAVIDQESQSGDRAKIISAGSPEDSELWFRITTVDEDLVMPPAESKRGLSDGETETLRRWIKQGAKYDGHWSFSPLGEAHESKGRSIDDFVDAKLRSRDWKRTESASKQTLIRRLSFDLTGLPPSIEDVRSFAVDDSESAYEDLVDRLLASTEYGERMASVWLDVARYSDTYGYQVDRERFVWPYRDWVIRAFNANLPYDQFITEQLAGDLLPNATDDQILATTFNRLHPQKVEGGSVPEEFRIEYVADRTQTFATSMLGLTLECCRCHDHKYDPLSQIEYYQLTAFFDKIDEAGLYSYFTPSIPTPTLMLDKDDGKRKIAEFRASVSDEESALATLRSRLRGELTDSSRDLPKTKPIEHLSFEDFKPNGNNRLVEGVAGKGVKLSGDDVIKLKTGNFHRHDPFTISLWLRVPERFDRSVVFHRSRAWTDAGSRGYECLLIDGRLQFSLIHFWPGNAISMKATGDFPLNEWHQVTVTYDGSSRANGIRLYLDGEKMAGEVVRDNLYKQITGGGNDQINIGERFRDIGLKAGDVDEFLVFDQELSSGEVKQLFDKEAAVTAKQRCEALARTSPEVTARLEKVRAAREALSNAQNAMQEIMVMQEASFKRDTYLLGRGEYDNREQKVEAKTPAVLPPMDPDLPRNRLGLAKWLTDPQHPLTSRVAVNRVWQMLFGEGLVRTPEDFGSQGQLPTHPELLDWLAAEFISNGWDLKHLIKQIVMSETYRQSSVASAELLESDPENVFLARAPTYRLPAEMLRDQALAVSQLLVEKVGGAPVKPYDLEVSFKPMKPDKGDGLYRRSLYTYWKRTGPAPAMMALDAAKRDVCRVKRSRTSSPLQTLVLLNGPQFVEAARSLAENTMKLHDESKQQIEHIFKSLTSRKPTASESKVLWQLFEEQAARFGEAPDAARNYLSVGAKPVDDMREDLSHLAALTSIANTLFGLDECMMKR